MNTTPPTNSFQPSPPPGEAPPASPSTAPRRRAGAKKASPAKKRAPKVPKGLREVTDADIKAAVAKKRAKKAGKKRAKAAPASPDTIKVSMKEYATMRVGANAKTFLKLHKLLQGVPKGSRASVLAELGKLA